jgi:hypothetical protein
MSQGWIETRLVAAEQGLEYLKRLLQDLIPQLRAAAQQARNAGAAYGGGGGGGGGTFFCQPSSPVAGATGTWPAITPTGFTADVYTTAGSGITLSAASAQCWNFMAAGLVASQTAALVSDGSGDFATYTQSCV